eukprot:7088682-Prymnesium_polylepis.1
MPARAHDARSRGTPPAMLAVVRHLGSAALGALVAYLALTLGSNSGGRVFAAGEGGGSGASWASNSVSTSSSGSLFRA